MAVYLVTWDLNREKSGYAQARAAFISHLQTYPHTKDGGLDSVWFVSTTSSAAEIDEYLRQKLDANDRLVVTRMRAGEYHGWLGQSTWEWIGARL